VLSADEIQSFGSQPDAIAITGKLLYPRTFPANVGISSTTPWASYAPRDFPRLGFVVLNQKITEVVFPNKGVSVTNVQGKDVIVLGCQRENYLEARLLIFPNISLTYLSDRGLKPCSP
jgi:hypothetical protein